MINRTVIKIIGSDAGSFLNSLTTNALPTESFFAYSLMLTPNGRFLFDLFIAKCDNGYILDINACYIKEIIKTLNLYILRSRLEVIDLSDKLYVIYDTDQVPQSIFSAQDPRFLKMGYRSIVPKNFVTNSMLKKSQNLYLMDKYRYCIPDDIDLIREKSIPNEYGMGHLNAISFNKGCYIGQELVNRVKTQGMVRKKIYSVISESDISSIKCKIFQNENIIGIITSFYRNYAIALIKYNLYDTEYKKAYLGGNVPVVLSQALWQDYSL